MQLEPCLHLGKELVPLEEQEPALPYDLHIVLSRSLGKACCFTLTTTGLRACLSLMMTVCCLERLLSGLWAH